METSSVKGALPQWAMVLGCFCVLVITMSLYFLMRYLFALIDIVAVPVCTFVPFVPQGVPCEQIL